MWTRGRLLCGIHLEAEDVRLSGSWRGEAGWPGQRQPDFGRECGDWETLKDGQCCGPTGVGCRGGQEMWEEAGRGHSTLKLTGPVK